MLVRQSACEHVTEKSLCRRSIPRQLRTRESIVCPPMQSCCVPHLDLLWTSTTFTPFLDQHMPNLQLTQTRTAVVCLEPPSRARTIPVSTGGVVVQRQTARAVRGSFDLIRRHMADLGQCERFGPM